MKEECSHVEALEQLTAAAAPRDIAQDGDVGGEVERGG